MAFSCTSSVAPPTSTFVPYVPRAYKPKPKPKPTPKVKSMARIETAEHSRTGVDRTDGEEWLQVDNDLTMLNWNASQSTPYEAADASHSVGYVEAFRGASELENPERDQFGGQSLDEGQLGLAMIRFLSGTSRGFPPVVE
ncbi:hypothetical protein BU23DRAFT_167489 [Bimuria novae-zelandiae CBS 107.79]|uniref:Uncharacterized protein n=1 Tax=Bimuria novae-zelandiae CBS 107.79 TaxID=1447943 RepID=A0A6A5VA54_9PLEO|nr:hypothetical protein BU23DRAFT_167489 [Bimuria novae-zelandiae CBS 107.79]